MAFDASLYPADWRQVSARIRTRAKNRCERCGILNYAVIRRSGGKVHRAGGNLHHDAAGNGELGYLEAREVAAHNNREDGLRDGRWVVIVLTVAHLNHDTMDSRDENLLCLCNRCHLVHDGPLHAQRAKETRDRRRGQGSLPEVARGV